MEDYIIRICSLYKKYNENSILKGLNLNIKHGEWISLIGQSGCGKTTLLNLIAGLDTIDSGDIHILNFSIKNKSNETLSKILGNHIGFIFQSYHLLSDLTVIENICLPYLNMTYNWKEAKIKARVLLDRVGMIHRENYYPIHLSGGEKQRVAICRALINNPEILLADEPTGNLDEENMFKVKDLLHKIQKEDKKTILLVTHNPIMTENSNHSYRLKYGILEKYDHS